MQHIFVCMFSKVEIASELVSHGGYPLKVVEAVICGRQSTDRLAVVEGRPGRDRPVSMLSLAIVEYGIFILFLTMGFRSPPKKTRLSWCSVGW